MIVAFTLAFCCALSLSFLVCREVKRSAARWNLLDKPGDRKIHAVPIPTGGGLGIGLGVLATFGLVALAIGFGAKESVIGSLLPETVTVHFAGFWQRSLPLWTLLGLASVLLVLGLLDDRFNLNWKLRLGVQTLVALVTVCGGWKLSLYIESPLLTAALSVFWIVGLVNSFNMLDNMNGLSAGVAAICASFLAAVMFFAPNPQSMQPQLFIGGFLIILVGAILGFMLHNNPFRASLFMGDGGAYFIGYLLAVSTLTATFSAYDEAPQTVFVPLLILAVPLYDTTTVVLIRLRNGKSPFEGDKNHFSHRLVDLGLSRTQAVLTIYLATAICCFGALLLYRVDFFGALLVFLQTLLVLCLIGIMEYAARKSS